MTADADADGPRACRAEERAALLREANRIFRPAGGDMGRDFPLLFAEDNRENLRVVVDARGEVVAHAGLCVREAVLGATAEGHVRVACLGAVFTRAADRGRGHGHRVVADALDRARAARADLALVSGDRGLYRQLGFVPVPPATCWRPPAGSAAGAGVGDRLEVTPVEPTAGGETLATLAALHDALPVRFVRGDADWRALLAASVLVAWPARLWLARRGATTAYLAVQQRARRRVLEYAGDRGLVLAAAARVSDELAAPSHDAALAGEARRLGWTPVPFPLAMGAQWLTSAGSATGATAATGPGLPLPWYGLNYV